MDIKPYLQDLGSSERLIGMMSIPPGKLWTNLFAQQYCCKNALHGTEHSFLTIVILNEIQQKLLQLSLLPLYNFGLFIYNISRPLIRQKLLMKLRTNTES